MQIIFLAEWVKKIFFLFCFFLKFPYFLMTTNLYCICQEAVWYFSSKKGYLMGSSLIMFPTLNKKKGGIYRIPPQGMSDLFYLLTSLLQ